MFIHRFRFILFSVIGPLMMTLPAAAWGRTHAPHDVTITPTAPWQDQQGHMIQAHGAGLIRTGATYYWFGEDHRGESAHNAAFQDISCYSSRDLAHWTFRRNALIRQDSGDLGPHRVVERPKVIYNRSTHRYVMYLHIDGPGYHEAKVGVATSRDVCGPYLYRGSFRPLGFQSRDIGLFQDDNGKAYLLSEDRANGLRIDALSADYLHVVRAVALLPDMEAPAMFKRNGLYYLLASHLSGWKSNDNQYTTATSPAGPWAPFTGFAAAGSHTYNTQTAFVLTVNGRRGTAWIYVGDRWTPADLGSSPYIWLPLEFTGSAMTLQWHDQWQVDAAAGSWQPGAENR